MLQNGDGRPEKPQNARDATQMFMTAFAQIDKRSS